MSTAVKVLRSIQELEEIRSWWTSTEGNRDSDLDFFLTLLRSNRDSIRPHVIVVSEASEPQCLFVGRIDKRQLDLRIGYAHLAPSANILYFVYGALRGITSNRNCELVFEEVEKSLVRGEADLAYLNFMHIDCPLYNLARTRPRPLTRDYIHAKQSHFSMTIPRTPEDFYGRLSPKVRKNQKWQMRKFEKDFGGDVAIRCFTAPSDIPEMMRDVEFIASRSYQRALGVGFFPTAEMKSRLVLKAERAWLRGYLLYVQRRPCAFWLGDVNGRTFGSEYLGYDPEFAKYSPGMYLITHVIESFCDPNGHGLLEIDFASGNAQYKELLSTREWKEGALHVFAPSLKGIQLNAARCLTGLIDQGLKEILGRTRLLQRAKKMWRSCALRKQQQILLSSQHKTGTAVSAEN